MTADTLASFVILGRVDDARLLALQHPEAMLFNIAAPARRQASALAALA